MSATSTLHEYLNNTDNPAGAEETAINRGVCWCRGSSDDSGAFCVPGNLACNLGRMSSRLPPIFPVCLFCQLPTTTDI